MVKKDYGPGKKGLVPKGTTWYGYELSCGHKSSSPHPVKVGALIRCGASGCGGAHDVVKLLRS